jgi:hypothetical protein
MIPVASAFLQSRLNSFNVIITCGDKRLVGPPDLQGLGNFAVLWKTL